VSPSSGSKADGELSFTVTCDPNTTYDSRNATVTIKADELIETISVTQDTNLGMLVTQTSYSISSAEQTVEIEVKANVNYVVDIPSDCKDWISHISTKSLTSRTLVLKISENKAYDDRTGYVTVRQTDGPLAETITINQKQADGLFVTTPVYELSNDAHTLSVEVKSNVQYTVEIDNEVKEWICLVTTKGLTESTVNLHVAKNDGYERTGYVTLKYENLQEVITIKQKGGVVVFEDKNFKAHCVKNFDLDGDGEISLGYESDLIETINCYNMGITSLKGIEWFRNLKELNCQSNQLSSFDVTNCSKLVDLRCGYNQLTNLDVHGLSELKILFCYINQLSTLNVRGCSALQYLYCDENRLTSLDVSECVALQYLSISENQVSSLDLSNCVALKDLDCFTNRLTVLDLGNCPSLQSLWCFDNELAKLDLKGCSQLYELNCSKNKLTTLSIKDCLALEKVTCYSNQLTSLDVNGFGLLEELLCDDNQLTNLNLNGCKAIKELFCNHNNLATLDVSECAELMERLFCASNPYLEEVWLRVGQNIKTFTYDTEVATIKYKGVIPPVSAIDLGIVMTKADGSTYKLFWADRNLGATTPEGYGASFAWGETAPKEEYSWKTYRWAMGTYNTITKYCCNSSFGYNGFTDTKTLLDQEDDAAHMHLGGNWRMPTDAEFRELHAQCTWEWWSLNGIYGQKVTGPNGNSIFLPATGFRSAYESFFLVNVNFSGYYWTSSLYLGGSVQPGAHSMYFDKTGLILDSFSGERCSGQFIRPVCE